jgi:hypothetical protein
VEGPSTHLFQSRLSISRIGSRTFRGRNRLLGGEGIEERRPAVLDEPASLAVARPLGAVFETTSYT